MTERRGPFWDMVEGRLPAPPSARVLGWRLVAIDPEAGTIRVEYEARVEFLNPVGTVQGGLLAAMLDDTMGPAAAAALGGEAFAQTLGLEASFFRPARPGKLYGAPRWVTKQKLAALVDGARIVRRELGR